MPLPAAIPIEKHVKDRQTLDEVSKYVAQNIEQLVAQWRTLREQKIVSWRKIYRGVPKEKYKSFPWKGSSNLVPRIVSSFTDQLTARLVMGLYGVDPLFPAGLLGEFSEEDQAGEQRAAVEHFMGTEAKSPNGLNLFHAEYAWLHSANKYGFAALKHSWEHCVEQVALAHDGKGVVFDDYVKYDGPRPTAIRFEDFLCPLGAADFRQANFLCHVIRMKEFDLRDREARGIYPKEAITKLLADPDRFGPVASQRENENDLAGSAPSSEMDKEWDLYECYFPYLFQGKRYQIIATYHLKSRTMLRQVFNFFPNNMVPFKLARLGNDGETIMGMGFCELLGVYQEEIAQIHNQRRDSGTLANTTIVRAPRSSQMDTNFALYPMAILPGEQGEYEFMQIGRATTETIKEEQMTLQLAQDAAGVGPSSAGAGAGSVNKKGAYSAMGTFATSQDGNTRANLYQTNSRFSHLALGNDLLALYAHFGVSDKKLKSLGKMGAMLQKALENVRDERIHIPIYAATGSINKEVEKQNKMLMLQHVRMTWQQIQQGLSMASNPMVPPEVLAYALKVNDAAANLTASLMRDFGEDDPSQYLPDSKSKEILQNKQNQQQQQQQKQGPVPVSIMPNANPDAVRQMAQQQVGNE